MATPLLTAPSARPSGARTATLWVFRILTIPQAILFVLQPISIGSFLQGNWEAFDMHSIVGGVALLPTAATALAGLVLAVLTRSVWIGLACLALPVLTTAQIAIGHTRLLVVHVPLGVLLVALAVALAIWPWTKGARGGPSRLLRRTSGTVGAPRTSGTVDAPHTPGTVDARRTSGTVDAPRTPGTVDAPRTSGTVHSLNVGEDW